MNKTLTNLIWRFAERCGAQLVSFVVSIILARILDPDAYGMVSTIIVFTTILQVFVDSGLGNALIQKKDADDIDFSTVFYTNIVFCTVLYIIVFLCAPFVADFYNEPSMTAPLRVLGLTVLISGVKNVQQAYISKNLLFKKFFFSTIGGTIGAAIVGIAIAYSGGGVWALVAQQLVNVATGTVVLWLTVKWRPKKCFSFKRLKGLYSFGWKLLTSSLIDTIYNDIRQLIIGKMYGPADLAFYNRGKQFPHLIVTNVNTSIDSVLLPVLSSEQDKKDRVKAMTRRAIKTSVYIMAPLMMGLAFTAPIVIRLILTEKWMACVPYMCIFCISYMFHPIHTANLNAIKAMGRSDLFLKLEIVKKTVGIILLLATMWQGVFAMACSMLVTTFTSQIINSWPNRKLMNYGYLEQIKDILPSILLATFMGGCVSLVSLINLPDVVTLIIQVVLGVAIYVGGSVIFKFEIFNYLLNMIKPMLKKFIKGRNSQNNRR